MRAAIIGAGPAGLYAAQALLRRFPNSTIDILESLPVPFGLIRYGVAPDHPATKNVTESFTTFVRSNRAHVNFYGNVTVSTNSPSDLPPALLPHLYDLTIHATGASRPRTLPHALPDARVHGAHHFLSWANGHPAHTRSDLTSGLRDTHDVGLVGVGNVALDVARLLLRGTDDLARTDISPRALDALSNARVRSVRLFARRAPRHAACTTAALRELVCKVPGVTAATDHVALQADVAAGVVPRATARLLRVMQEHTVDEATLDVGQAFADGHKLLQLHFQQAPELFKLHDARVRMETTTTDGTDAMRAYDFDQIFLSLGYEPGKGDGYRVGWANGKARGIIGDNKWDAESVVVTIQEPPDAAQTPAPGIKEWLRENPRQVVTWEGWERIDEEERRRGLVAGRGEGGRIKVESVKEMLELARGAAPVSLDIVGAQISSAEEQAGELAGK